jgi:hypothetical protein
LLSVLVLHGEEIVFQVRGSDLSIAPASNAKLLAPTGVMQDIAGLIAGGSRSIRAGHIGARRPHAHGTVFHVQCAMRLQLSPHGLVDLTAPSIVRRDDDGVFRTGGVAFCNRLDAAGLRFRSLVPAVEAFLHRFWSHFWRGAPRLSIARDLSGARSGQGGPFAFPGPVAARTASPHPHLNVGGCLGAS